MLRRRTPLFSLVLSLKHPFNNDLISAFGDSSLNKVVEIKGSTLQWRTEPQGDRQRNILMELSVEETFKKETLIETAVV